jgi:hypothetical protein
MPEISIVELRQYTLHGGRRDELIALFEREFIEPQDAVGAHVLGTFRDLDDPDRFVWIRGFSGLAARKAALEAFYGGPVWRAHCDGANATMLDSDNVLLLDPLAPGPALTGAARAETPGLVRVSIHQLAEVDPGEFRSFFRDRLAPHVAVGGGEIVAELASSASPNTFPRLPVREGESVFVWLARFPDPEAERDFTSRLRSLSGWRDGVPERLLPALMRKPEVLRLSPTARSPLR